MVSLRIAPVVLAVVLACPALAEHPTAADAHAPSTADRMAGLQTMCDESTDARAERHAATPLYERLGGYDRILALTTDIVARHQVNEPIKRTMKGVDPALLAKHVADFLAAGTGGDIVYTGRDLPASHAHLNLTTADFLAAGSDIAAAMQAADYGQDEIDEVLCLLVALKDQVVFE